LRELLPRHTQKLLVTKSVWMTRSQDSTRYRRDTLENLEGLAQRRDVRSGRDARALPSGQIRLFPARRGLLQLPGVRSVICGSDSGRRRGPRRWTKRILGDDTACPSELSQALPQVDAGLPKQREAVLRAESGGGRQARRGDAPRRDAGDASARRGRGQRSRAVRLRSAKGVLAVLAARADAAPVASSWGGVVCEFVS
jgi:hypothetical protein